MGRTFAIRGPVAALVAIVGMVVGATAAPAAAAPPGGGVGDNKTFTVDVDGTTAGAAPETFAGDANATIALTITNTSPSQQLGSADVTVPTLFTPRLVSDPPGAGTATVSGQTVQLRNLALLQGGGPGSSVTVTLTVDVGTCVAINPAPFSIKAKQSNDFKGTGNDYFMVAPSDLQVNVTGQCSLAFFNQPKDAERSANITSVAFDPTGAKVTVEVLDAGNTGRATSSAASITLSAANGNVPAPIAVGNATATASAGLATFTPGPTLSASAFGYTFTASSTGLTSSSPSTSFAIVDDHAQCPANKPCDTEVSANNNGRVATAKFGTGTALTNLTVSLGAADAPGFVCNGYPRRVGTLISQFAFTDDAGGDRLGTFSITIPNASDPLNSYEVCWASTVDFITESGLKASLELDPGDGGPKPGSPGETLNVGLLPDCPKKGEPTAAQMPCVSARFFTKSGKTSTAHLEVKTNGADPWAY